MKAASLAGGCFVLVGGWVLPPLYPAGGVPALSPPCPALACFPAPLPRRGRISPRPPSPSGKGETKVISCKGLRPLHPRAEPKRRWEQGRTTHPAEACPAGWRLTLPPLYPAGGVPALSPAAPAISAPAGGGLPSLSPPCPAFSLLPAPLPRRGRIDPQPALAERSSRRHLLSLPRGRGPSQTPKFLSPGPPSPWLPALPIERRFYRFCAELAIPKAHPPGAGLAGRTSAARV